MLWHSDLLGELIGERMELHVSGATMNMTSKTGRFHLLSEVKPNGVWKHHVAEKKLNS
jgi:hypothetical protein